MNKSEIDKKEKAFLEGYDSGKFPCPSVAADMVIFSIMEDEKKAVTGSCLKKT
jgi:hypothetical protein